MARRRRKYAKKPSCLGILCIWVLLFAVFGNHSGDSNKPNETASSSPASSSFVEEVFNKAPSIAGSNALDIIKAFERQGIPAPEAKEHYSGGWQWTADPVTFGNTMVIYDIVAGQDYEIQAARFYSMGAPIGFLPAAAMLPYDQAQSNEAQEFVRSFSGTEIKQKFGDAEFTVSPHANTHGAILTIQAEGYENYLYQLPVAQDIQQAPTDQAKQRIRKTTTEAPASRAAHTTAPTPTPTMRIIRAEVTKCPDGMVWIPRTGKRYHKVQDCSDMKSPKYVLLEEAIEKGYTPCKDCVP